MRTNKIAKIGAAVIAAVSIPLVTTGVADAAGTTKAKPTVVLSDKIADYGTGSITAPRLSNSEVSLKCWVDAKPTGARGPVPSQRVATGTKITVRKYASTRVHFTSYKGWSYQTICDYWAPGASKADRVYGDMYVSR